MNARLEEIFFVHKDAIWEKNIDRVKQAAQQIELDRCAAKLFRELRQFLDDSSQQLIAHGDDCRITNKDRGHDVDFFLKPARTRPLLKPSQITFRYMKAITRKVILVETRIHFLRNGHLDLRCKQLYLEINETALEQAKEYFYKFVKDTLLASVK